MGDTGASPIDDPPAVAACPNEDSSRKAGDRPENQPGVGQYSIENYQQRPSSVDVNGEWAATGPLSLPGRQAKCPWTVLDCTF